MPQQLSKQFRFSGRPGGQPKLSECKKAPAEADNSLILALPNGGTLRLAPGGKIIGTDKKNGQIKVVG